MASRFYHLYSTRNAPAPCGIWRDCSRKINGKYADKERQCQYYYTCMHGFFLGHNRCNEGKERRFFSSLDHNLLLRKIALSIPYQDLINK